VEHHVARALKKLGVLSRHNLAHADCGIESGR
jgi:DNA-binding CsgD family transcriptional regulator